MTITGRRPASWTASALSLGATRVKASSPDGAARPAYSSSPAGPVLPGRPSSNVLWETWVRPAAYSGAALARLRARPDRRDRRLGTGHSSLARRLDLTVVAEGVETATSLRRLGELACDLAEGFLFRRPLRADELEAWARSPRPSPRAELRRLHRDRAPRWEAGRAGASSIAARPPRSSARTCRSRSGSIAPCASRCRASGPGARRAAGRRCDAGVTARSATPSQHAQLSVDRGDCVVGPEPSAGLREDGAASTSAASSRIVTPTLRASPWSSAHCVQ